MQTVLLENLGNCSSNQCIGVGAAYPWGTVEAVFWQWSWKLEYSTRYLDVGEFCIQEHKSLKCELHRVLDVWVLFAGVVLCLCFFPM